jgi:tRNA nucleotidyltransferase (CCA-adding enzyme)
MSDYIYMLESRLSPEQRAVVSEVQATAAKAAVNVFLIGGAMRDMLGGFPIRDFEFVVEGNALKFAKTVAEASNAKSVSVDETRKRAVLLFSGGVTAEISAAHRETFARPGAKPQISAATIQEDLRNRDFTCNAVALSLNEASRGLLLDPMNGLADIERRELRIVGPYGFYDDPSRLLSIVRFRVRLGFGVEERTAMQMANAREAEAEKLVSARTLGEEMKNIAFEDKPAETMAAFQEAGLLPLFSPLLAPPKLNTAGLGRLEKTLAIVPAEPRWRSARLGPFLCALAEKLSAKERLALAKGLEFGRAESDLWQKLPVRAKKLETVLRAARLQKPSQIYQAVVSAPPDEVIYVLSNSEQKLVRERLKNYFQKYLPALLEIPPEEWATIEGAPGTPRYQKARDAFIKEHLDRRPKKPPVEEAPEPPPPPEPAGMTRRPR